MTVVHSVCMEGDSVLESLVMPDDAVVVNNIEGDNLSFTVTQEWSSATGLAVLYTNQDIESSCDIIGDVTQGDSRVFEGTCIQGVTALTVIVFMFF